MRIKNFAYRLLGAVCAFAVVACVDDSFNIDDVSKEVTIGSGTTTVPLGYLDNKTLGDLLGGENVEGLEKDEEGNLSFKYSGESETIDIEGISTEFDIPEIKKSFDVEYPAFNLEMSAIEISEEEYINVVSGLDSYISQGCIPEGVELPDVKCQYTHVVDSDKLHIEFDVPNQVANVNKVIFRDVKENHHGAPLHLNVALNGLKDINAGGKLVFDLTVAGGTFRILDAENQEVCDGERYSGVYEFAAGVDSIDFVIYIESITNTKPLENHHLDLPLELTFDMEFEMATKAGKFDLDDKPHIELTANFEYGDASVTVDNSVNLVECEVHDGENPIEITGLPEELKMVQNVGMKQDERAILKLYAHGMEWMGDLANDIDVEIALPDYLKLHFVDGQEYTYDPATYTLTTTVAELNRGVAIGIDELFFKDGCTPEDGVIELSFEPSIVARFKDDAEVSVSKLMHDGDLEIEVGIEEAQLCIESLSGMVDYSYEVDEAFALTGLDELNLEIAGLGLKPVIEVTITHPLTMETTLSGSVTPCSAGVENLENRVEFGGVALQPATYADGAISPVEVVLVIADESLRQEYTDAKYTFVACDVTKLLLGTLPDTFAITLKLAVDPSEVQTLYIDDENFSITYDYKVDVPFTIDNSFEIHYSDVVDGLNSTFSTLADYDIKVGDLTIVATVVNTTPLEFAAQVVLLDVDGNPTEAQVHIAEDARIKGSVDGATPAESVLRLVIDLGAESKLSSIALVDAIAVDLRASSAANESAVPLNNNQYVGVKLHAELAGGITVDIDKLPLK